MVGGFEGYVDLADVLILDWISGVYVDWGLAGTRCTTAGPVFTILAVICKV